MSQPDEAPARSFSPDVRARNWTALEERTFDLLVVGAGITGSGIALDAACRGLSVALVDAGDFARGTSSRSSRLVHGGLRYLETFDLGLVFEALRERQRLLHIAPHLVHPLPFLFPVFRGGGLSRLKLATGMFAYDALTLFRGIRRHRLLRRAAALEREPRLRKEGLLGGALYYDAQVDDARLTLAVARAAHEAGAVAVTHARVTGFVTEQDGRTGGARVADELGSGERLVRARLVVLAVGPWLDELRALVDPAAEPRLRPTKGVHIVLRRERVGNAGALIFRSPVDGRIMFVLPWADLTYVGTTDTDVRSLAEGHAADAADVRYLLASVNALFPEARLEHDDVISSWSGVRPLLAPARKRISVSAGKTSREHEIWMEAGVLCVAGGKLTTYRSMAAETVDRAARILRRKHGVDAGDCYTEHVRLPGAPDEEWEEFLRNFLPRAAALGLSCATGEHLARAYGSEADAVLDLVRSDAELGTALSPPLPYILAEVDHVVEHEMPLTLEDVMRRRLHLIYEAADQGMAAAERVARRMALHPDLAWSPDEVARQLDDYRAAAREAMAPRSDP